MTKRLAFLFWINLFAGIGFSQMDYVYKSLEDALAAPPDSVYRIDLSRSRLNEVPAELSQFKNLREVDLSKNKITDVPIDFFSDQLEIINLNKNKLDHFPEALCKHKNLKELYIAGNNIDEIPESIGELTNLVVFEIWFNPISIIPESMTKLRRLRTFDLRGMNYSEEFQQKWHKLLPWVKIEFDVGCDCGL